MIFNITSMNYCLLVPLLPKNSRDHILRSPTMPTLKFTWSTLFYVPCKLSLDIPTLVSLVIPLHFYLILMTSTTLANQAEVVLGVLIVINLVTPLTNVMPYGRPHGLAIVVVTQVTSLFHLILVSICLIVLDLRLSFMIS